MDGRYWVLGAIYSIVAHVVLVVALVLCSRGRTQEPDSFEKLPAVALEMQENLLLQDNPQPEGQDSHRAGVDYVVQPGDTLSAIAKRIGCTVDRLAEVNDSDVRKLSRLRVGQRLVLPE